MTGGRFSQFRFFGWVLFALPVLLLATADEAHAQTTVGGAIANVINSFGRTGNLLTTISYVCGIMLAVAAMFKFRDHVDRPHQVLIKEPVTRLIAGGMFLTLPFMVTAVKNLVANGLLDATSSSRAIIVVATPASLDEVAAKFIADIASPMSMLLSAFSFIAGLALMLVAINRLTKTAEQGARGPTGMGTIMTFISAGALMSVSKMAGAFSASLFGDSTISTHAVLSASMTTALGASATQVVSTIDALMLFIMIVGYIAFIRGWFVLKAFADGAGNVSIAQGMTFLLGGSLAINLGDLINAIAATLGYTSFGVAFS